ncbi:MAG: glycosyltransferase [Thermoproteus sp.]|nr:glycosyltransferase [Thermoproteus sp.]
MHILIDDFLSYHVTASRLCRLIPNCSYSTEPGQTKLHIGVFDMHKLIKIHRADVWWDDSPYNMFRCVDGHVAISPYAHDVYTSLCKRKPLGIVPRPIPSSFFEQPKRSRPKYLMLYSINPREGRKGDDIIFMIRRELKRLAEKLSLQILCKIGRMEPPYLDICDVVVANADENTMMKMYNESVLLFPSKSEGLGMPIYESLAAGGVVVVPDAEYVRGYLDGYPHKFKAVPVKTVMGTLFYPADFSDILNAVEIATRDWGEYRNYAEVMRDKYVVDEILGLVFS